MFEEGCGGADGASWGIGSSLGIIRFTIKRGGVLIKASFNN